MIALALLIPLLFGQADPGAMRLAMEAQQLYVAKDYAGARERAESGARAGSPDAMILLAVIYSSGNGAPQYYGEVLRWYRAAADKGSAAAMYNLALLYQDGRGALKDTVEAERWFRAAADAGYAPARRVTSSGVAGTTPAHVSAPSVKVRQDPEYSEQARPMLVTGTVVVAVVVAPDGVPYDLRVVSPLGFGLDEKAIEAVTGWRFNPGLKDGHAVNVAARIEVNFRPVDRPADRDRWRGGQMAFETAGPVVTSVSEPLAGQKEQNESVSFEFTVNQSGHASEIRILHGAGSPAADQLEHQLSLWTFRGAGATGRVRFILNDGDDDAKQPLFPAKPAK